MYSNLCLSFRETVPLKGECHEMFDVKFFSSNSLLLLVPLEVPQDDFIFVYIFMGLAASCHGTSIPGMATFFYGRIDILPSCHVTIGNRTTLIEASCHFVQLSWGWIRCHEASCSKSAHTGDRVYMTRINFSSLKIKMLTGGPLPHRHRRRNRRVPPGAVLQHQVQRGTVRGRLLQAGRALLGQHLPQWHPLRLPRYRAYQNSG